MIGYIFNGCGNRFLLLDNIEKGNIKFVQENAPKLCTEEHNLDGILCLSLDHNADVFMHIINKDGSIAKMCGNGVRIVAQYLNMQDSKQKNYTINTLSGVKSIKILENYKDGCISQVDIGKGIVTPCNKYFDKLQTNLKFDMVDVGNLHAVFLPDEQVLRKKQQLYESLQGKNGVNVEFIRQIDNQDIAIRVFERGCGETAACGTGASAVAFSLHSKGYGDQFNILMPGGRVNVKIKGDRARLTGPTTFEKKVDVCLSSSLFFHDKTL